MSSSAVRVAICVAFSLACARCASVPASGDIDKSAAASIAGEWGIQMKEGGHTVEGTLHFSFDGVALVGSYLGPDGEVRELERIRVAGGRVYWQMDQKTGLMTAKGDINGTIMSGKMKLRPNDRDDSISISGGGRSRTRAPELAIAWTAIKRAAS